MVTGWGAAVIADSEVHFFMAVTSYNKYYCHLPKRTTLFGMDKPCLPQLPHRFGHTELERFLRQLLRNQEIFATDFWESFVSMDYRIDKILQEDLGKINDRLWALEHPKAEKT
jgi:hypothetical protein